jgi:hypothetical protein
MARTAWDQERDTAISMEAVIDNGLNAAQMKVRVSSRRRN